MKQNSKKNVTGKLFGKNILSIVAFACLFAIAFTSCKEEEDQTLKPEGDLSQVTVGNAYFQLPFHYAPAGTGNNYVVHQFVGNDLNIQIYAFLVNVRDVYFKTITVTDTVIGDTVKVKITPNEENAEPAMSLAMISMNFFCTIYDVPRNKEFYVEFEERYNKVTKKFLRK